MDNDEIIEKQDRKLWESPDLIKERMRYDVIKIMLNEAREDERKRHAGTIHISNEAEVRTDERAKWRKRNIPLLITQEQIKKIRKAKADTARDIFDFIDKQIAFDLPASDLKYTQKPAELAHFVLMYKKFKNEYLGNKPERV